ncbi:MAG TPA: chemotaxis protein CheW [Verrucomicrobiae bacterium]|nr:chemotaxis protein CheW [Verrucomicrobiae bacterium]
MTAPAANAAGSFVLLQVGNRRFALSAEHVAELAPPVRLHTFPHESPLVIGVIVRRGRIVPVYDVAPILIGRASGTHRFYLIAGRMFGRVAEPSAIPLHGECELATGETGPPEAGSPAYISGSLSVGEARVPVLDLEALVTFRAASASPNGSPSAAPGRPR